MLSWMYTLHSRLRQSEYVGPNRCLPCTVVNLLIAVALAGAFTLVALPVGVVALVTSLAAIYFRGYLIPGTPTLTQQYFPDSVLAWFGKQPTAADGAGAVQFTESPSPAGDEVDGPAQRLVAAGVVQPCSDSEDLCLAPKFKETWWRRIEQFRERKTAKEQLAATIRVDPDVLSFDEELGPGFTVSHEGEKIAHWSSKGAFLADLAADPTLGEWLPGWDELPDNTRTELLVRLRALLQQCPACNRELDENVDTMSSCCGADVRTVSLDCPQCGTVFSGTDR